MSSHRIFAVITGIGATLAAGALAVLPVHAAPAASAGVGVQAHHGWHLIGTYDHYTCFQKANWYQNNGATYTRCDDVGGGRSELWVFTN